ncbi:MAG: Na+/H+ antiporter NhaC family protein [Galactobacter sp.]
MSSIQRAPLKMYGGALGGSVPLLLFIAGMIGLTISGGADMPVFWAVAWIACVIGFFFAASKSDYCSALIRGIGNSNGAVVITLYFFAGVFGQLLKEGGLVEGLLWIGTELHVTGAAFAVLALICAMAFSVATGTSVGTAAAMTPVLYPAGVMLGCDPAVLAVAILAGAGFGDNCSPHSDTTIASAASQGAEIKDVVKARIPFVLIAAAFSIVFVLVFGGGGEVTAKNTPGTETNPWGLLMFLSFLVLIFVVFRNRHMIEAFIWGIIAAVILGLVTNGFSFGDIFHFPAVKGDSSGLVQDGIASVANTMIFVLIILGLSQIMVEAGVIQKLLQFCERFVRGKRSAELAIIGVTTAVSVPISHNTAAALVVGPGFVNAMGRKFGIAPSRRAIMMDCSVTSLYFTIPWHSSVITWFGMLTIASHDWNIPLPSLWTSFMNPYAWGLFIVTIIAALTGWKRKAVGPHDVDADEDPEHGHLSRVDGEVHG